jgi:hypothetical protein
MGSMGAPFPLFPRGESTFPKSFFTFRVLPEKCQSSMVKQSWDLGNTIRTFFPDA